MEEPREQIEPASSQTRRKRLAQLFSVVGHPFVLIPLAVLIVTSAGMERVAAMRAAALITALTILPALAMIALRVRRGEWSDWDVSVRKERHGFYPIVIVLAGAAAAVLAMTRAPEFLIRGTIVSVAMIAIAALVNRASKISLHMTFVAFCATIVLRVSPEFGACFALLALAVAWSRVALARHTRLEAVGGLLLGAIGGIATAWL